MIGLYYNNKKTLNDIENMTNEKRKLQISVDKKNTAVYLYMETILME